jgi:glutaredoxin
MEIKLYTTHCPQCKALETKLAKKNVSYEEIDDQEVMKELGFKSVPMLQVDGQTYNFSQAIKWVNSL